MFKRPGIKSEREKNAVLQWFTKTRTSFRLPIYRWITCALWEPRTWVNEFSFCSFLAYNMNNGGFRARHMFFSPRASRFRLAITYSQCWWATQPAVSWENARFRWIPWPSKSAAKRLGVAKPASRLGRRALSTARPSPRKHYATALHTPCYANLRSPTLSLFTKLRVPIQRRAV